MSENIIGTSKTDLEVADDKDNLAAWNAFNGSTLPADPSVAPASTDASPPAEGSASAPVALTRPKLVKRSTTPWNDRFVPVHRSAVCMAAVDRADTGTPVLTPQQFFVVVVLMRMRFNPDHAGDNRWAIQSPVDVLVKRTGVTRKTLRRWLDPREGSFGALAHLMALHTDAGGDLAHDRWNDEGREIWRIDITPLNIKGAGHPDAHPDDEDSWVRIPWWWLWEDPDDTEDGNEWAPRRFISTRPRNGQRVEADVTAEALFGAAVVAARPRSRSSAYGIAGLATESGISGASMRWRLAAADDFDFIRVADRQGRRTATRVPRLHPDDPVSADVRPHRGQPSKARGTSVNATSAHVH